jgi:hypothetical protein
MAMQEKLVLCFFLKSQIVARIMAPEYAQHPSARWLEIQGNSVAISMSATKAVIGVRNWNFGKKDKARHGSGRIIK